MVTTQDRLIEKLNIHSEPDHSVDISDVGNAQLLEYLSYNGKDYFLVNRDELTWLLIYLNGKIEDKISLGIKCLAGGFIENKNLLCLSHEESKNATLDSISVVILKAPVSLLNT